MKRASFLMIAPWSRRWWATWFRLALAGASTRAMTAAAERGRPYQIAASEVGFDLGWIAIPVGGAELQAWRAHMASMGDRHAGAQPSSGGLCAHGDAARRRGLMAEPSTTRRRAK